MAPEIWLDYLEDELDPSLRQDLGLHVESCSQCRKNLNQFQEIKKQLKNQIQPLPSEAVFENLQNRIMSRIEKMEPEKKRVHLWRSSSLITAVATAAMAVLVVTSVFTGIQLKFAKKSSVVQKNINWDEQWMVQNSAGDPEFFSEVIISHENSGDMILEAAAGKLSRMSDREVRMVLDRIK